MKEILQAVATASNNSPLSSTEDDPFKAGEIAWHSVFTMQAIFIVVGNALTIVLFASNKNLRKKSLYLVINMAFADIMCGAVVLSVYMHSLGLKLQLWATTAGTSSFIYSMEAIELVVTLAALLFAVMISAERSYAIFRPLKHRTRSMRAYRIVITMVWTLAILAFIVFVVSPLKISAIYFVLSSCALCLLFIVCGLNIAIWRKFHLGTIASQQQRRASQNQRLTKTLLFVSVAALASWLPLIIYDILVGICELFIPFNISHMVTFLFYFNSIVNPLVYALRIPEFKQALGVCCFRRQAVINREGNEGRDNRAAALTPVTQLRTLPTDPSYLQLAFKEEILDTKM